jgi:hypothetical protein
VEFPQLLQTKCAIVDLMCFLFLACWLGFQFEISILRACKTGAEVCI